MRSVVYPAIIEQAVRGFGVFFPDLPGCVSSGRNRTEAAMNACDALSMHLAGMLSDGDVLPVPTDHASLRIDPSIDVIELIMVRGEIA